MNEINQNFQFFYVKTSFNVNINMKDKTIVVIEHKVITELVDVSIFEIVKCFLTYIISYAVFYMQSLHC